MIGQYGADICRLFMILAPPPDMSLEWSDTGVEGVNHFPHRVWRLAHTRVSAGLPGVLDVAALNDAQEQIRRAIHLAIRQASQNVGQHYKFNTIIATVMTLMNVLEKASSRDAQDHVLIQEGLETAVPLLAPITPHICHVPWGQLGHAEAAIDARWPNVDESALAQDTLQLVVQVNGKLRKHIDVATSANREDVEAVARASEDVLHFTEGLSICKVIVVSGKLVSIIAN